MYLWEALKSNRRYKRPGDNGFHLPWENYHQFSNYDVLADDWEVEDLKFFVCPFCKSERVNVHSNCDDWFVRCEACDTTGPSADSEDVAIKRWNKARR